MDDKRRKGGNRRGRGRERERGRIMKRMQRRIRGGGELKKNKNN